MIGIRSGPASRRLSLIGERLSCFIYGREMTEARLPRLDAQIPSSTSIDFILASTGSQTSCVAHRRMRLAARSGPNRRGDIVGGRRDLKSEVSGASLFFDAFPGVAASTRVVSRSLLLAPARVVKFERLTTALANPSTLPLAREARTVHRPPIAAHATELSAGPIEGAVRVANNTAVITEISEMKVSSF